MAGGGHLMTHVAKQTNLNFCHYAGLDFKYDPSRKYTQEAHAKPIGLWLSVGDVWDTWCRTERYRTHDSVSTFEITADKSVLLLDDAEVLREFTHMFSLPRSGPLKEFIHMIDWPRLSSQISGIVINPYIWSCRLDPSTCWYYGWDVASGCIWDLSVLKFTGTRLINESLTNHKKFSSVNY